MVFIHLRPTVASRLEQTNPWSVGRAAPKCSAIVLHPSGFAWPTLVAEDAGALLPHPFTVAEGAEAFPDASPPPCPRGWPRRGRRTQCVAVCSLLRFPPGHPDQALPGTLPWGARTFLPRGCLASEDIQRSSPTGEHLGASDPPVLWAPCGPARHRLLAVVRSHIPEPTVAAAAGVDASLAQHLDHGLGRRLHVTVGTGTIDDVHQDGRPLRRSPA